jgi:mono/diheme cytochrome c family protein/cytochrome bd-type quinol oxidase subunit 1
VPAPGLFIAVIAIVHVFVSQFAVGGGLFLVLAERWARKRNDEPFLDFLRKCSRAFILLTLVFGALTGVGIWITIGLVSPQATSALIQTFVWGWAIEWTFFATEIVAAMVYYYGWDRLDARTHVVVGWIYFVSAWMSLAVINGILTFMMTSGTWPQAGGFWTGLMNPTYLPVLVLRTAFAIGVAGLYALLAGSFVRDQDLKARILSFSGRGYVLPAAVLIPASLSWFLSSAAGQGVPVAAILGAPSSSASSLLAAVFSATAGGHPVVRQAALAVVVASTLLGILTTMTLLAPARRFGPRTASLLMLLGFVAMGGAEFVREGLRKPWAIDRVMFVNGVWRAAPVGAHESLGERADAFTVEGLGRIGVLASSRWDRSPDKWQPDDPSLEALPPERRASEEAAAGREVFRLLCATCHTTNGYLGIRRLVAGKSVSALERMLDSMARPVTASGDPTTWGDPHVRLDTWLERRMPPFPGTDSEKRALAVHLARLGGDEAAGTELRHAAPAQKSGRMVFEESCSPCHGNEALWPMRARLKSRSEGELNEIIGRLPQVQPDMPPFEGTDEERRALATFLSDVVLGKELP